MMTRLRASLVVLALTLLVGQVTDATTGQPLPHLVVTLTRAHHQRGASTTTNGSGHYRFRNVLPGVYTLTVQGRDVPPMQQFVTVRKSTTTADVTACSTALDYSCAPGSPGAPGGGG